MNPYPRPLHCRAIRVPPSSVLRRALAAVFMAPAVAITGAFAVAVTAPPAAAAQVRHEGVAFDTVARVGDAALQLNGMGLRGVAWIRAFVAGLYVQQPSRDAQRLLTDPGPKRLTLKILLDAPASELSKAVRRGVRKNVGETQLTDMADRLERLATRIDEIGRVHPGDTLDLDYQPGRGMVMRVNGQTRGAPIAGADLYRAVLAIFIGERPVDATMKQGLLAGGVNASGQGAGAPGADQVEPPTAAGPAGSGGAMGSASSNGSPTSPAAGASAAPATRPAP